MARPVLTKTRAKPVFAIPSLSDEERRAQVWEMRLKGYTHEAIARELEDRFSGLLPKPWNARAVYDDCTFVLNSVQGEYKESASEMVQIEQQRFDAMLKGIWDKAEAGDVQAIDRVLDISNARRKMLGLDNPERFVVDWRIQLVQLLQNGTVTPQMVATEFGDEILIEVNQKMLEMRENG